MDKGFLIWFIYWFGVFLVWFLVISMFVVFLRITLKYYWVRQLFTVFMVFFLVAIAVYGFFLPFALRVVIVCFAAIFYGISMRKSMK